KKKGIRSLVNAAIRRPIAAVLEVAQPEAHPRFGEYREVEQCHVTRQLHEVRREGNGNKRHRVRRIERIGEKVVVPVVAITTEGAVEVVPVVLGHPQDGHVVRVAAIAEAGGEEVVEEDALVIKRMHFQSLSKQAGSWREIHVGGVDLLVTRKISDA